MPRYVVCYDVTDNRRRNRIVKVLKAFGTRQQKSVFELVLSPSLLSDCLEQLQGNLDPGTDSLAAYRLCGACDRQRTYMGQANPAIAEEEVFIV